MITNIQEVQKVLNIRMSRMIHIIKDMTEFKERHIIGGYNMGLLEKIVLFIKTGSFKVKKILVRENREKPANIEQWLKRGLNAKRIIKYIESEEWFFTLVVWYI